MVLYESSKVGHDSLEENSVFVTFFRLDGEGEVL